MKTLRAVSFLATIYLLYFITVVKSALQKQHIIGGKLAVSIPYQASLQLVNYHHCGAAIISKTVVVTAAHCFEGDYASSMYSVRAGSNKHLEGGQLVPVLFYVTHPKHNKTTFDYDIAIVFLGKPLKFDAMVQRIKLVKANALMPTGVNALISGWGVTSEDDTNFSYELRFAHLPLVNQSICKNNVGMIKFTDRMICAGYLEGGVDTCQKDSGGPLVVKNRLIGIVSVGDGCAHPNKLGVYTNVAAVREWIDWVMEYKYVQKLIKQAKKSNSIR